MATPPDILWSKVVEQGGQLKVFLPPKPKKTTTNNLSTVKYIPKTILKRDNYFADILYRKAAAIVHQSLTDGSVLFAFPKKYLFASHTEAYEIVEQQLGATDCFQLIGGYAPRASNKMLIEMRFSYKVGHIQAISQGVTHNNINIRA
ncbi:hypothetical protein K501DRAFT_174426 [Backusella circina FSU 941]|nr:hypothetical protein K501DRAFT_174426 [Backusella circina FSU 941]